jgi:hypothetical protein
MYYTDIKEVREMNGSQFIRDFRKYRTPQIQMGVSFFTIGKSELWRIAKIGRIVYTIRTDIFIDKRPCMVITSVTSI